MGDDAAVMGAVHIADDAAEYPLDRIPVHVGQDLRGRETGFDAKGGLQMMLLHIAGEQENGGGIAINIMDLLPLDEADAFLQPFRRQIHGIERHLPPDSIIQVVQNGLLVRREKRRTAQGQEPVPESIPGLFPHPEIEGIVESPGIIVLHIPDRISCGSAGGSMTVMETWLSLEEDLVIMLPDDFLRERRNLLQVLE